MKIEEKQVSASGVKLFVKQDDAEIARAFLYILKNDLHKQPFGFIEDVFVHESLRGQGIGGRIVDALIAKAKSLGCYKVICTSRYGKDSVHKIYLSKGFKDHGKEFRMNF